MNDAALFRTDCLVIGAGVVGLAVARELALRGRDVIVVEAAHAVGTGISARNSEVIHAGIYYRPGSLKAKLCVEGKRALYEFCESRAIPHRRCGKLIVACDESDVVRLEALKANALANGVEDLEWAGNDDLEELRGTIRCHAALLSPSTGIIDSHALMLALQADAEAAGAQIVLQTPMIGAESSEGGLLVRTGGVDPAAILCRSVVNAAGLQAVAVASTVEGLPASAIPHAYLAKGSYFSLARASSFKRLVYPLPEPGGLGIHLTLDLGNQARFGPDVEWVETEEYSVDADKAPAFYRAIRRYWPTLPDKSLQPAYAGIRPKISGPGEPDADFMISGPDDHGVPGLVNLFGIESPGLTASMAIATRVADQLQPLI